MCSNFIEAFTDKVIEKLGCPCGINNYKHYDTKICDLLIPREYITPKDERVEVYLNVLISCLHDNNLITFFEILKHVTIGDTSKILTHLNCYNFGDKYFCYKPTRVYCNWKSRYIQINEGVTSNFEKISFNKWFNIYFDFIREEKMETFGEWCEKLKN